MALTAAHIAKVQNPGTGAKERTTIADINDQITGAQIKTKYEAEADTNAFTDAEKTKLAGLDPNHFRGTFVNLTALQAIVGVAGDYGDVDAGAGSDVQRYIWDADDNGWVAQSGAVGGETAASIKTKYESNADTNAFTDAEQTKLAGITGSGDLDALTTASHAAVTLAANTGFVLTGQQVANDYSILPVA